MWVCMYDEVGKHSKYLETTADREYKMAVYKMIKWWLKCNGEKKKEARN